MGGCESKDDIITIDNKIITKIHEVKVEVIKEVKIQVPIIKAFECQISNELFTEDNFAVILPCGHTICLKCYYNIIVESSECPYDKKPFHLPEPIKNYALMNEVNKELSKKSSRVNTLGNNNNNNINDNSLTLDLANNSTYSIFCPNLHVMKFLGQTKKCSLHLSDDSVLGCIDDQYYQCIEKCVGNKLKFSKSKCLLGHTLEWFANDNHSQRYPCYQCKEEFNFGFRCYDECIDYIQCIYCSDFRFGTHICPNGHNLKWSRDSKECLRCSKVKSGFECIQCKYFLCYSNTCRNSEHEGDNNFTLDRNIIIKTIKGHTDAVFCLVKLNDKLLASGSWDKTIKLWNLKNLSCVKTLQGHADYVQALEKLSDTLMLSGSYDCNIKVWNYVTFSCIQTIKSHTNYVQTIIKFNNNIFVSGSWDKSIKIWNNNDYSCLKTLNAHTDSVITVIKVNENHLASGSYDRTIRIWDINTYTCVTTFNGHSGWIHNIIRYNNDQIISGGDDDLIKIWSYSTGGCIKNLTQITNYIWSLLMLNDNLFISGSVDGKLKVWNILTGTCIKTITLHNDSIYSLIKLNEFKIVSGSYDSSIKVVRY